MVGVCHPGCLDHLFVGGIQPTEANILHDGIGEQEGILQHQAKLVPQVSFADIPDILAVDGDPAAVDLIRNVSAG